jgi:starvation-inducible DNA-binding protein
MEINIAHYNFRTKQIKKRNRMNIKNIFLLLLTSSLYAQEMSNNMNNLLQKEPNIVNIGLSEKDRKQVNNQLNVLLANEYVLYTKTLKYHWNVEGPFFGSLHALFREQYEQLLTIVDHVAERIRSLGFMPFGTLQELAANASLKEQPGSNPKDMEMIRNLLNDHETIIKQIRKDIDLTAKINDMGTNNFLCDLIEKHEKTAWMLRAHLGK